MSATEIAMFSLLSIIVGSAIGIGMGRLLPHHHLESDSKDVVRLAMAMIGTMTALVLGLVTGAAKDTFDTDDEAVKHTAALLLMLDRDLANYGAETKPIRDGLRTLVGVKVDHIWSDSGSEMRGAHSASGGDRLTAAILDLTPTTDAQRWYRDQALAACIEIMQTRWFVFNGSSRSVQMVFLIVMVCWLSVLFGSFGLFAPTNTTVVGALFLCAASVSAAIFLILEMDDPFTGLMRISDVPIRYALAQMGQ